MGGNQTGAVEKPPRFIVLSDERARCLATTNICPEHRSRLNNRISFPYRCLTFPEERRSNSGVDLYRINNLRKPEMGVSSPRTNKIAFYSFQLLVLLIIVSCVTDWGRGHAHRTGLLVGHNLPPFFNHSVFYTKKKPTSSPPSVASSRRRRNIGLLRCRDAPATRP